MQFSEMHEGRGGLGVDPTVFSQTLEKLWNFKA